MYYVSAKEVGKKRMQNSKAVKSYTIPYIHRCIERYSVEVLICGLTVKGRQNNEHMQWQCEQEETEPSVDGGSP